MSGHSKWDTIKHKKAAADAKRSNAFGKLSKAVTIAARDGADLDSNFKLRLAVDKAKAANMPKDNIQRAIDKGAGTGDGDQIQEVVYEGYGPSGIAILVETATDNRNRTAADVKHIFSKYNGSLGSPNSVQWMFEYRGMIKAKLNDQDIDELQLELIDFGAEEVEVDSDSLIATTTFENFPKLKKAMEDKGLEIEFAEMEWIAKDSVAVEDNVKATLQKMFEAFEENDDVTNYFTNAEL